MEDVMGSMETARDRHYTFTTQNGVETLAVSMLTSYNGRSKKLTHNIPKTSGVRLTNF